MPSFWRELNNLAVGTNLNGTKTATTLVNANISFCESKMPLCLTT